MNTNLTRERISTLLDGELDEVSAEGTLPLLHSIEGRAIWESYHQVGDVLRSDEIALTMSPDFSERLFARLDAEPSIVAPTPVVAAPVATTAPVQTARGLKRFILPGMAAAAAVATVAFITTPQLMVANGVAPARQVMMASPHPVLKNAALESPAAMLPMAAQEEPEEVMLRDPGIDDYLFAHQRFSPSVYSTSQFARSATFASQSDK